MTRKSFTKKEILLPALLASSVLLLGLQSSTAAPAMPSQKFVEAINNFSIESFTQLGLVETRNVVVSPLSASVALSMLMNGAAGDTQTAMRNGLGFMGMDANSINVEQALLRAALTESKTTNIANSIWLRQGANIKPEFLARTRNYHARATTLDFANPQAVNTINNWVKANTKGKIPSIVDSLRPETFALVINAIYFKGEWAKNFEPATQQPFYFLNGQSKNTLTMTQHGKYDYQENENFSAVALPYKDNMRMLVFAPKETDGLRGIVGSLTPSNWKKWRNNFKNREGTVSLPKFKFSYDIDLRSQLWGAGIMTKAFEPGADFSAISNQDMFINQVKHKAMIEVNERGTTAAAVTGVHVVTTSIDLTQPFEFKADRPFVFAIEDSRTGALVFLGTVLSL